jgi:Ras GTPase-activating protein 1
MDNGDQLEMDRLLIGDESVSISAKAPPESSWYHGRLNRSVAEERLNKNMVKGSYLIRESDRKPGSFVLSYLGQNGINHFKITCVCGTFFIGGRPFDSLSDVVAFYTHASNLLTNERLTGPVKPPEPVNDLKKVIAILPYSKMPDSDELSFQKGDIFFVHNEVGEGWLWVTAHRTGDQGMIFKVRFVWFRSMSIESLLMKLQNVLQHLVFAWI